jgi:hypothetical protein
MPRPAATADRTAMTATRMPKVVPRSDLPMMGINMEYSELLGENKMLSATC